MESSLSFFRMHWDDEPVWSVPSVRSPALRRPGPAKAGTPNGRFMASVHFVLKCIWDHEPVDRAAASWTAPVLWRFRLARLHSQSARRLAHSKTWRGFQRFLESGFDAFRA